MFTILIYLLMNIKNEKKINKIEIIKNKQQIQTQKKNTHLVHIHLIYLVKYL
jgi:hypothetical protein